MPKYQVTGPDGRKYSVNAPEGATQEQVLAYVQENAAKEAAPEPESGIIKKAGAFLGGMQDRAMETVGGIADLSAKATNALGLTNIPQGYNTRALKEGWNSASRAMGGNPDAFVPQTDGEKFLHGAGGGVFDAATMATGAGAVAGASKAGGMTNRVASALASQPGMQAAAGAVGGGVGEVTDNPYLGLAASMAVPVVAGAVKGVGEPMLAPFRNPEKVASEKIAQRLADDGLTTIQAREQLRQMGPNATIADLGENVGGLGRAAVNVPGPGKAYGTDVLAGRQSGRAGRILQSARQGMDTPPDYYSTAETLDTTRKTAAAPLYAKAYEKSPVLGDDMQAIFSRPSMKGAMGKAYRIAAEEGRDPTALGLGMNDAGDVVFTRQPSMQTLDYVKRGLDDVLEGYRDSTTGKLRLDTEGRAINATRAGFLSSLKKMNPDYEAALNAYSGPSQSMDALYMGRRFINNDPEVTAKILADMPEGDRAFFRAGAMRAIQDLIRKDTAAAANKFAEKKDVFWSQLRTVFPSEKAFNEFRASVQNELKMARTEAGALTGSRTTPLARDIQDLEGAANPVLEFGAEVLQSGPRSAIVRALIGGARKVGDRVRLPTEALADKASRMLYAQGEGAQDALTALERLPGPRRNINPQIYAALLAAEEKRQLTGR